MDYHTAGIYLALRLGPQGLEAVELTGLTPVKLSTRGRPVGSNNWEVMVDQVSANRRREAKVQAQEKDPTRPWKAKHRTPEKPPMTKWSPTP